MPARSSLPRRQGRRSALLVALAVVATAAAACSGAGASTPGPPGPSVGQQLDARLPASVAGVTLRTTDGRSLSLSALRGKVVVVSDVMTLCQETCPLDTADLVAAAQRVEAAGLGRKVEFLSVTIDPERDTTAQLSAYRALYAPAPADWAVATGTSAGLARLWKRLGVYIQKVPDQPPYPRNWRTHVPLTYDLEHSDELFFLGTDGRERFILEGAPHVAAGAPIPAALSRFMDAEGHQDLDRPDPMDWTLPQALDVIGWLAGHRVPDTH